MEVRVYRGRAADPTADREVTTQMLSQTAKTGRPAVRVWQPHQKVAFGRRDSRADGYEDAKTAAEARGYRPVVRRVGGRAVAYTGQTLAFIHTVPIEDIRRGMCDRYAEANELLVDVLFELSADVTRGEPANSYCPGSHSVSGVDTTGEPSGKLAGLAQRIQSGAALVSGCLTVDASDEAELRAVLGPVYRELDIPFNAKSVGSVSTAGGPDDPAVVAQALENAFVDGHEKSVVAVGSK